MLGDVSHVVIMRQARRKLAVSFAACSVKRASNDTLAGRRYLDLQREAKRTGRPTDELIQLYALECFLDRLVHSNFADTFILKGGVLLAALDALEH